MNRESIFKVVDANSNRLSEGIRVCEDISRFILNDPVITRTLKSLRHRSSAALRMVDPSRAAGLRSRDVGGDIGRSPGFDKRKRASVSDLFMANIKRSEESARVLEEFLKLLDCSAARRYKRIRFDLYVIEQRAVRKLERVSRRLRSKER